MHRLGLLFVTISLAAASCSNGVASEATSSAATPRTISTSGRAVMHVAPDRAQLTLGVETHDKDLDAAKRENDARIRKLLRVVQEHGIDATDIHTSWISIQPEYSSYSQGRTLQGYRVSNTVMVSFKDVEQVEPVLSAALTAGANSAGNVVFRHSQDRSHRDRAREMALRAAREKAEAMAAALGQRVGRPITITESAPTWINPMSNANVFNDQAAGGVPDEGDVLAPGRIQVDARVHVSFELLD